METSFSIIVADQPPPDNRQIAESLADQIFCYEHETRDEDETSYDYRMNEKWLSSCEAQSLNPAKQDYAAFVKSQEADKKADEGDDAAAENDDDSVVDEMVIARILRGHTVDYTSQILKKRKDSYDMPLPGLPVVTWRRNRFTRIKNTLFSFPWPHTEALGICMQDYILMQGCGMNRWSDGEEHRDPRTYQTLKLFVCALDAIDPTQQDAKREWIYEQV